MGEGCYRPQTCIREAAYADCRVTWRALTHIRGTDVGGRRKASNSGDFRRHAWVGVTPGVAIQEAAGRPRRGEWVAARPKKPAHGLPSPIAGGASGRECAGGRQAAQPARRRRPVRTVVAKLRARQRGRQRLGGAYRGAKQGSVG
jgi:hypothetical protein